MKRLVYLLTMFLFLTTFISACSTATNTASSTDEGTSASDSNKGDNTGNASKGSTVSANAFATTDLQGTWNYHGVTSGDSPAWLGWFYGQGGFDSSGVLTYTSYLNSDGGSSLTSAGNYSISTDGIITHSTNSTLHGAMNQGKDFIVRTLTWGGTEVEANKLAKMTVFTKTGGTYTTADLQGTWNFHTILSGDSPSQRSGWAYGTASVDSSGNYSESSVTRSNGGTGTNTFTFDITADGIVTINVFSTFHGVMSQDKNMIVGTGTDGDGGFGLIIFQKAGGTFVTSDLAGTWNYHLIATGDSPQWTGWVYGQLIIDSSGNYTGTIQQDSDGGSSSLNPGTFATSSAGVVTDLNTTSHHAVMSSGKDMMIGTTSIYGNSSEVESYALFVLLKAEVLPQ